MTSEKYNSVTKELLRRLCKNKDKYNLNCVDFTQPFPYDQFTEINKEVKDIVQELENEFNYEMSELQCSWAVVSLIREKCEDVKE